MESSFCIKALERAIANYGTPEIFNTDQGSQFTDRRFTGILEKNGIRISMDGKGRCLDNVFIERLWRDCEDMRRCISRDMKRYNDARAGLKKYFWFYNNDRLH
ncbi:hypothetical protein FACS1894187_25950 [Synergistales bacterium]|nr:hypothetical protein FACS1894187_25950 [Synergistales bacterium]